MKHGLVALEEILGENRLIGDSLFDEAYDRIEPWQKGVIKKSIALGYKWNLFRIQQGERIQKEIETEDGTFVEEMVRCPCFALVLSPKVDSPSQVISLLLPPRIIGIKEIIVFGLYEETWPLSILLSLEFLGIERVYFVRQGEMSSLVSWMLEKDGVMWALVSPDEEDIYRRHRIHEIFVTPSVGAIFSRDREKFNREEIVFSHPSLSLVEKDSFSPDESFDVIYAEGKEYFPLSLFPDAPFLLGAGHESLWLWPSWRFSSLFYFINYAY